MITKIFPALSCIAILCIQARKISNGHVDIEDLLSYVNGKGISVENTYPFDFSMLNIVDKKLTLTLNFTGTYLDADKLALITLPFFLNVKIDTCSSKTPDVSYTLRDDAKK